MNTAFGELTHFENPTTMHRSRHHTHISESNFFSIPTRFDRLNTVRTSNVVNAGVPQGLPVHVLAAVDRLSWLDHQDPVSRSTGSDVVAAAFTLLTFATSVWFGGLFGGVIAIPVILTALAIANFVSKRAIK